MQNPPTNTYYTNTRPEMLQYIPAQARTILDVGCATGIFGAAVKRQLPAAEVWGVEILPEVAAQARQHLDVVVNAPFDDAIDLPAQYFDAIVFNDSLEHLPDDRAALRLVKKFLKPETGRVVCSIPNVRYIDNLKHLLLEMDWRYEESGIRDKLICVSLPARAFAAPFRKPVTTSCNWKASTATGGGERKCA